MKIYIHTLGCKVNQFESQALETIFENMGYTIANEPHGCDAIVLNTCAVTAESVRKSRQALRRLSAENPGAVIGVCGCWSQLEPEVPSELGANIVFGSSGHVEFANVIHSALSGGHPPDDGSIDSALSRRE